MMRRYDLDWLRVLVFALLIFYHVGMLFVPWDFHLKNNITYQWMTYPMWFVNQWRLPILFVISGMGTFYALQKRSGKQFILERVVRLYIPLSIGMLFIVPPQVFYERLYKNQFAGNYTDFWPSEAFAGVYPEGNFSWHHLWFLPYLLLFSIALVPFFVYMKNHLNNWLTVSLQSLLKRPLGWFVFILPLYLAEAFVEPYYPVTHTLIGDWFTVLNYLILFFFGFTLVTAKEVFWSGVVAYRRVFLTIGVVSFAVMLLMVLHFEDSSTRHFMEAFVKVLNLWSWILALFGFAAKHLNKKSKTLAYANEAVYPFYILHQTVMIIFAFYLIGLDWALGEKFLVLVTATFGMSWIIYEFLIRRWKYVRPLFGLKIKP
jgi:hypothetical protein